MNLLQFRERALLILLILLPFHAFLITVLTRIIAGANHAPLTALALWKEALLLVILILACVEISPRIRQLRFDALDRIIAALFVLALFVTIITRGELRTFIFGFRYDFVPLIAFVILRHATWSSDFLRRAATALLWVGGIVAALGLAFFILPQKVLMTLGYSDLHSLYLPGGPLAPFQQIGSLAIRRMQSTMSGPNQLGLWLLLPWSVGMLRLTLHWQRANWRRLLQIGLYLLLIAVAIVLTFSRAAWIAAFLITIYGVIYTMLRSRSATFVHQGKLVLASICTLFALSVLGVLLIKPDVLLRSHSSNDHVARPIEAVKRIVSAPLGSGLGTAGPASNRISDTCVFLPERSDFRWAKQHPNLCIFLPGDPGTFKQVQPRFEPCNCPFLPENWYLQMGVELGILGFVFFAWLIVLLLWKLPKDSFIFYAMLGVALAGLVLHSWEDSAVSYSVWILSALAIGAKLSRASSHQI